MAQFLLCFSLIQNTNRILSTKVPPGAITSINGMRVLSMWWVILGHCYYFMVFHRPSKLFHIFNTKVPPKIYSRGRNNSSKSTTVSEHFLSHSNHSHTDMQSRGRYSHTLPIWVCAAQRGRDFEAPDLEWGIHFRGVF